jgi:AraC-like DNA-binding protein
MLWLINLFYCIEVYSRRYLAIVFIEPVYYASLIYLILFLELRYKRITAINNGINKYKSSDLGSKDALIYKNQILDYIKSNELYKDHELTLGKLAKLVSLKPHLLSQIINEQMGYNFNDFINFYRIEDARKMLTDPEMQNYTIASIAYDSGFNTLSAFNAAFKKFTRLTPSQFRTKEH